MSWEGMNAYATASNLKPYIDTRVLSRLISDTGKPSTLPDPFTDTDILPHVLSAASGELEAALFVGAKYTVEDIEGMATNGQAYLRRIMAGLVLAALYERRGVLGEQEQENRTRETVWARKQIDLMRKGTRILPIAEVAEARAGTTVRDESPKARQERNAYTNRFRRVMGTR